MYSILIPTYNERENIPITIYLIYKHLIPEKIDFEIVIVEDNSPDGTLDVILAMTKFYNDERIKILSRSGKLGLGTAYVDGIKKCSGDFIFIMDADLSHNVIFIFIDIA